jgi:serine/threonine protein kinase
VTPDGGEQQPHRIAERYAIKRELGSGGMGVVYEGVDELLDRPVAVKEVLLPRYMSRTERDKLAARVLREARAAARLNHHGAVTIYDIVLEQGTTYIVMELVEARTLADVVEQDGPMAPEAAAQLGLQILAALEAAHLRGIVHRDVKPANVMVLPDGRTKLTDFGIATMRGDPKLTTTGVVLGSPTYMAPEHASGYESGPPADLYSLGATLYFAVEGVPPFQRNTPLATMTAVVHDAPRPMERAGQLATVIRLLTAKRADARPTAVGIRGLLEDVVSNRPLHSYESDPAGATGHHDAPPTGRTHRSLIGPAASAAAGMSASATAAPSPTGAHSTTGFQRSWTAPNSGASQGALEAGDAAVAPPHPTSTERYPVPPSEPGEPGSPRTRRQLVVTIPDRPFGHGGAPELGGEGEPAVAGGQPLTDHTGARRAARHDPGSSDTLRQTSRAARGAAARRPDSAGTRARKGRAAVLVVLLIAAAAAAVWRFGPWSDGGAPATARPGWVTYAHPKDVYVIDVPRIWQVTESSDRVTDFVMLGERTRLRVRWSPTRRDPTRALNDDIAEFRRNHEGFRTIGTDSQTVAGRPAAAMEFRHTERGETIHATHLTLAGKSRRTFYIEFSTLDRDWAKRGAPLLEQLKQGFRPSG